MGGSISWRNKGEIYPQSAIWARCAQGLTVISLSPPWPSLFCKGIPASGQRELEALGSLVFPVVCEYPPLLLYCSFFSSLLSLWIKNHHKQGWTSQPALYPHYVHSNPRTTTKVGKTTWPQTHFSETLSSGHGPGLPISVIMVSPLRYFPFLFFDLNLILFTSKLYTLVQVPIGPSLGS